jgi:Na+/glutamate symporter
MSFSAQLRELAIAYGITAIAMLIGLLLMRADRRAYFRWPVYSAMAMTLGVVSWNLMRQHMLPEVWIVTHPGVLYYSALALYFVFGLGLGLLLGRLTKAGAGPGNRENSDIETK